MLARSKKYYFQKKIIGINNEYNLLNSIKILKNINTNYEDAKYNFDQSIDLTIYFSKSILSKINASKFKIYTSLPYSIGKNISIAIIIPKHIDVSLLNLPSNVSFYKIEEILQKLEKKIIDFDILYASKDNIKSLMKYKKILENKGVMPSETLNTLIETENFENFLNKLNTNTNKYSMDKSGTLNFKIGKISFPIENLHENSLHIINLIKSNEIIGKYIKNLRISSTMSPSIKLSLLN